MIGVQSLEFRVQSLLLGLVLMVAGQAQAATSWAIDQYYTFTVVTHSPTTGAATDADSVPTYRVYEDETATPILTGSMALLDSTNTDGHYSERIQLTAANGFEQGKSYNLYISATVGSVTGVTRRTIQIAAATDLRYWLGTLQTTQPRTESQLEQDVQDALATQGYTSTRGGYLDNINGHTPQTGDSYARIGAPAGASLSADMAAVKTETALILADTEAQDTSGELRTLLYGSDTPGGTAANQTTIIEDTNELQTDWANGGRLDLLIDAVIGYIDTEVAAILADTGELQTDWANGGRLDLLVDAIIGYIDTEVAAILEDTGELQTDLADGGRLDSLIDAMLADTNDIQEDWASVVADANTAATNAGGGTTTIDFRD